MDSKWLIIIDVDGTLLKPDGVTIPEINVKVIHRLIDEGHIICVNTGRGYYSIKELYHTLRLKHLSASFSGNYIYEIKTGKTHFVNYFDNEYINKIVLPLLKQNKIKSFAYENERKTYLSGNYRYLYPYTHLEFKNEYHLIDEKGLLKDKYCTFFIEPSPETDWKQIYNLFNKLKKYNVYKIPLADYFDTVSDQVFIELNSLKYNKGTALKFFQKFYKIDDSHTLCIGDSKNDIPMFKASKNSVALRNAKDGVQQFCNYITKNTAEEGGLGIFLNKFFKLNIDL